MIKRTFYFGNPCKISVNKKQLIVEYLEEETEPLSNSIEDIGLIIFDNPQIYCTTSSCNELLKNNTVIVWCNEKHMPYGMLLSLSANQTYNEKLRAQVSASIPLKKQLWKQTIQAKIKNQAYVLDVLGEESEPLLYWAEKVLSGDKDNKEARASCFYWGKLLSPFGVNRGRFEGGVNSFFNYGYAILRSIIARNLIGSGCLLALGIFHHNKYNPFCLADDIMEPYRPIIDLWIMEYLLEYSESDFWEEDNSLSQEDKVHLLQIPTIDIKIDGKCSPLMVGSQRTTASLMQCFEGIERKILYPEFYA